MKLKQRAIISCGGLVTFGGLLLILDNLPNGGVPFFFKQTVSNNFKDEFQGAHISAIRKRLNKSNYSSDDFSPEGGDKNLGVNGEAERAHFLDVRHGPSFTGTVNITDNNVDSLLSKLQSYNKHKFNFDKINNIDYNSYLAFLQKRTKRKGRSLQEYRNLMGTISTGWEKFHKGIHQYGLYSTDDSALEQLLTDMTQEPIIDVEEKEGGTQLKLIITFSDEGQALFKPRRFNRDYETLPDHFYFVDFERHNAEIAAFHLDMVLGFYRVPPTAGREVNVTYDIKRLADHKLAKTFFRSPADNVCFHGSCSYYCDTTHAICGHPDMLEGSFAAFLPPEKMAARKTWRNPWKRSYSKHRKAYWEVYDDLCDKVKLKSPYNKGRRLLDLMDLHIFDFLTGNMDRHHYETFREFGNDTFLLHLDNGRSFGKTKHDEMSILAPLYQCCRIRYSTFMKLSKFYTGPDKLSMLVKKSLTKDKLSPILTDPHFSALDRRVMKILKEIFICLQNDEDVDEVIIDDFF